MLRVVSDVGRPSGYINWEFIAVLGLLEWGLGRVYREFLSQRAPWKEPQP